MAYAWHRTSFRSESNILRSEFNRWPNVIFLHFTPICIFSTKFDKRGAEWRWIALTQTLRSDLISSRIQLAQSQRDALLMQVYYWISGFKIHIIWRKSLKCFQYSISYQSLKIAILVSTLKASYLYLVCQILSLQEEMFNSSLLSKCSTDSYQTFNSISSLWALPSIQIATQFSLWHA